MSEPYHAVSAEFALELYAWCSMCLGGSTQDAMSFSRYGINAVSFTEPLERQAVLKMSPLDADAGPA